MYNKKFPHKIHFLFIFYSSFDDSSGWVPLLITLMYEFNKDDSFWRPYLDLIPDIGSFGHPLFWKEEEIKKELSGMIYVVIYHLNKMNLQSPLHYCFYFK